MLCLIITNAFLAVLAYLFLLRYIVDSQMAENLVSLILGASKSQIILCIFWESMILALVANGAGLLGHWLLYEKIFIHLNVYSDLSYRAGDYFFVYLVMVLLSLATIIPFVMKYLKLSPVAARQKYSS